MRASDVTGLVVSVNDFDLQRRLEMAADSRSRDLETYGDAVSMRGILFLLTRNEDVAFQYDRCTTRRIYNGDACKRN